jgi:hypothetical protein
VWLQRQMQVRPKGLRCVFLRGEVLVLVLVQQTPPQRLGFRLARLRPVLVLVPRLYPRHHRHRRRVPPQRPLSVYCMHEVSIWMYTVTTGLITV